MTWHDRLKGGAADKLKPSMFPRRTLQKGAKHELEHTDDWKLAMEIAMDHLAEDPKYYVKLAKMERKMARKNPSSTERQRRFMCAEYGRAKSWQADKDAHVEATIEGLL